MTVSISHHAHDDYWLVKAFGELDLCTITPVEAHLRAVTKDPTTPHLIVDLTAVTFFDCTTLGIFCRTRNALLARGGWLRLVSANSFTAKIVYHAGLDGILRPFVTVQDALSGVGRTALPNDE